MSSYGRLPMASKMTYSLLGEDGGLSMVPVARSLVGGASACYERSSFISLSKGERPDGASRSSSYGYGNAPTGAKNPFLATWT